MSQPWHRAYPALFDKERAEVEAAYPNLHFHVVNDIVLVRGTFPIAFERKGLDGYLIEIELSRDYPKSIPIVRETGGRIPRTADRHMNPADGTACILLPDERWNVWPHGSTLLQDLATKIARQVAAQSFEKLREKFKA